MKRCCGTAAVTAVVATAMLWVVSAVAGNGPLAGPAVSEAGQRALRYPRVIVLKSKRRLYLFEGETLVRSYPVALGFDPVGDKLKAGDGRTPEGRFRICTKNAGSPNHRFLGIDYPNAAAARRSVDRGFLTTGQTQAILQAEANASCPPWTTPLGGAIGIHGGGVRPPGSPPDWTAGCIAMENRHVDELFAVLRIGDPVEILP